MNASVPTLLRRTAAIIVATGSFCFTGEAAAAPPINYPGGSCTLSRITITPSGGLAVECETATSAIPSITLGMPSSMTVNTAASFSINRSSDAGPTNVSWSASGVSGCVGGATLSFTAGGPNSLPFSLTPAASGSCSVALNMTASSAGALGSPSQASYTVASTAAPASPSPSSPSAGCPTGFVPPTDLVDGSLQLMGNQIILMPSGRIYSSLLPTTNPGRISGTVKLVETPQSAQILQSIEMSISKCKGEIKTDAGYCYAKSQSGSWNTLTWLQSSYPGFSDADVQTYLHVCFAKLAEGPWYFNMRYTYSSCIQGTCGYAVYWSDGGI